MSISGRSTLAQFAQASYVTLADGDAGATLSAKLQTAVGAFAATQTDQFAAKYSVVLQYNDDTSPQGNSGNGVRSCLLPPRHSRTQEPLASYLSAAPRVQGSVQPQRSSG